MAHKHQLSTVEPDLPTDLESVAIATSVRRLSPQILPPRVIRRGCKHHHTYKNNRDMKLRMHQTFHHRALLWRKVMGVRPDSKDFLTKETEHG